MGVYPSRIDHILYIIDVIIIALGSTKKSIKPMAIEKTQIVSLSLFCPLIYSTTANIAINRFISGIILFLLFYSQWPIVTFRTKFIAHAINYVLFMSTFFAYNFLLWFDFVFLNILNI